MKIGHNPELANAIAQNAPAKQQAKDAAPVAQAATQGAAATRSGAAVTFSSAARTLDASARTQGDFDAGKVRAMREAIEKGSFKINAGAIADKLLSNAQEAFSHARV